MRFENVQLAVCNRSVGFGLASVCSPIGGVAIDVAEITHVSQVYLGSLHDEWRGKLLLAGTKVGRKENSRSEICKFCLFTCKTATTSAGLMVCVIHKTKLCHWLLDLVAEKSPGRQIWGSCAWEWKSWAFYLSHSRVSSTFLFFLPFVTHPLLREEKDHIQHLGKTQNAEIHKWYASSWLRALLLVDKCYSDQSERKKTLVSEGGGNNLSLCLC